MKQITAAIITVSFLIIAACLFIGYKAGRSQDKTIGNQISITERELPESNRKWMAEMAKRFIFGITRGIISPSDEVDSTSMSIYNPSDSMVIWIYDDSSYVIYGGKNWHKAQCIYLPLNSTGENLHDTSHNVEFYIYDSTGTGSIKNKGE
jgi:hypothetical protein